MKKNKEFSNQNNWNHDINILTYNLFLRPPFIHNNENDFKNERCNEFIHQINRFDIICLQEVFDLANFRKRNISKYLKQKGYTYIAKSPRPVFLFNKTLSIIDAGLITLSKYPIIVEEFRAFEHTAHSDRISQKGVLYTKIKLNNCFLHLFSTHLQASHLSHSQHQQIQSFNTRIAQLLTLRKFLDYQLKKQQYDTSCDKVVVVGDFNIDANQQLKYQYSSLQIDKFPELNNLKLQCFTEYEVLTEILSNYSKEQLIDCVKETYGKSQITYGDSYFDKENKEQPSETILTHKDDWFSKQALDYIFIINNQQVKNQRNQEQQQIINNFTSEIIVLKQKSAMVEKFHTAHKNYKFNYLSDHYGISVALQLQTIQKEVSFYTDKQIKQKVNVNLILELTILAIFISFIIAQYVRL